MTQTEMMQASLDELEARLDDLNGNAIVTYIGERSDIDDEIRFRVPQVKAKRASLKSRKALAAALVEMGRLPADYDYRKLNNEIYGRDARIYLHVARDLADRITVEHELTLRGFKVCKDYDRHHKTIEVKVSYFKGWHWAE